MKGGKKIAIGTAAVAIAGVAGYFLYKTPPPPAKKTCEKNEINLNGTCTPVKLTLSSDGTDFSQIPVTITFTAVLTTTSGKPVPDYALTLTDQTTGATGTSTTNTNGVATFKVTIKKHGTYTFMVSTVAA